MRRRDAISSAVDARPGQQVVVGAVVGRPPRVKEGQSSGVVACFGSFVRINALVNSRDSRIKCSSSDDTPKNSNTFSSKFAV